MAKEMNGNNASAVFQRDISSGRRWRRCEMGERRGRWWPLLAGWRQVPARYVEGRLQAVPSITLQHSGALWQIVVRDLQLLEIVHARDRVEAVNVRPVQAESREDIFAAIDLAGGKL